MSADDCLKSLKRKHLRPLVAEFFFYYDECGLASGVDLLCVTTESNRHGAELLVPIELKWGADNTFNNSTGPLFRPLALATEYNNSPKHQAFLQLAFYRQMLIDHYPEVKLGPAYVAQVRNVDTVYHPLPLAFIDSGKAIKAFVFEQRYKELIEKANASSTPGIVTPLGASITSVIALTSTTTTTAASTTAAAGRRD
jgi:hypothetical protein